MRHSRFVGAGAALFLLPLVALAGEDKSLIDQLDAPLLFVKRHSFVGLHIYDTFYKWPPGGGGIYVLENPRAPKAEWKIRPIMDSTTPGTLGIGVYSHPELSWDAQKIVFCFKGEPDGSTSIYEIGIDGKNLRRLTDPSPTCDCYRGSRGGQHDVAPAYLPDGRIVFLSTRSSGLVPCANSGVAILHVMNADGSDIHPISVNHVNEFDPSILPDGRILFGRWEYVDKNALTIQSLWTMNPDGTQETSLYANNMVFPESLLDARPVPNSHMVVATLAKHNAPPRGSIAFLDPRVGKNDPKALSNLEHPDDPTFDRGDSCEPWPLSENAVIFSGRPAGQKRNAIELMDRTGHRVTLLSDPDICLHSPMLIKPRPVPPVLADAVDRKSTTGRFFVQDIYQGMPEVERGEIKWLRVMEETSRVSATPGGKQPYNQTFLISAALAFSAKIHLGIVPVEEDGSAYFEAPAGRAVFFQALDAEGRLIRSMRTFVQAAPGTTRSCIGCHEYKFAATTTGAKLPQRIGREPARLQPESWGTGYLDYPTMVQPVLDKHCVRCHGGREGIDGRMDLTGGWTEHFNISYENLANRCETQLTAYWISGIDCMNGTALHSSKLFPPRSHGSGAAPLAKLLIEGHGGRIPELTRPERDLLLAWIDTNGVYHGTWDYSRYGCALTNWDSLKSSVLDRMQTAGCTKCHAGMENDWVNLQTPEWSRILRAPMAKGDGKNGDSLGLGLCRDRKVDPAHPRLRLLWSGYAHAVQPPEKFPFEPRGPRDESGNPFASFASTADANYQAFLSIIRLARGEAFAHPRVDMPGAEVMPGASRMLVPPALPETAPPMRASTDRNGIVTISWERSAKTIGLEAEVHRGTQANFTPTGETLLGTTGLAQWVDMAAPAGKTHYALIFLSGKSRSRPSHVSIDVPQPSPPPTPADLKAAPGPNCVRLTWAPVDDATGGYRVFRAQANGGFERISDEAVTMATYSDAEAPVGIAQQYVVRAVNRRGLESEPSRPASAAAVRAEEPVFVAQFDKTSQNGKLHAPAKPGMEPGTTLDLRQGGLMSYAHRAEFDLNQPICVEFWLRFEPNAKSKMPVVVGCGLWRHAGWFVQTLGGRWRWHVGGVDCDGGKPDAGRWMHLVALCEGKKLRLYQDGKLIAQSTGTIARTPWAGPLCVGQYNDQASPDYQTFGQIAGLKIYHRPLSAEEIEKAAKTPPSP